MEEQQESRNVGERELERGQPSRNSGQTGLDPEEHRIEISPRVKNWIESLKNAEESTQSQSQWPRIPKVPHILRGTKDFKKLYEPRVISIGPYHHGKPHLHPMQMIKPLYARNFLADSNQEIEALYTKIESNIEAVRKCYDWSSTSEYDDEALAWMMLLDGCFLLQFIRSTDDGSTDDGGTDDGVTDDGGTDDGVTDDGGTDDGGTDDGGTDDGGTDDGSTNDMSNVLRTHQINFVEQDLFLLENQLPFGVLKFIFEGAKFNDGLKMEKMIKKFVTNNGGLEESTSEIHLEKASHLLGLLRSALVGKSEPKQEQQPDNKGKSSSSQGVDGWFCSSGKKGKQRGIPQSFRNIKELKAAGIHLQPSGSRFLTDISFNPDFFCGYLNLPPITVDDSTKSRFLNIVAYEMCPGAPDDYTVTSYICFLYELIDHADDVKELRSKHILYNCLGSDEDVAQIFNEIGNDVVCTEAYNGVKDLIQEHYEKRVSIWIAEAFHDYLRSPWTFMALIAAVLILILTGVQTYYTHPGKYIIYLYVGSIMTLIFYFLVRCVRDYANKGV